MKHTISKYDTVIALLNELKLDRSYTYHLEEKTEDVKFIIKKMEG